MRKIATICFISWFGFLHAQNDTLVFKQVSYSFMPIITSPYLYFTSDGIMWFSTENGITSFDGSERVYHSNAKEASVLGLNAITCMAEDSLHNLYIAGHSHLIYYNRKTGKINVIYDKPGNNTTAGNIDIACIYINSNGLVYAGTTGKGLFIYDTVAKTLEHINIDVNTNDDHYNLAANTIKSFATYPLDSSKLWLGTFNGIYVFDKKTKKFSRNFKVINPGINRAISTPVLYDIRKMYVADDSTIWFSTFANGIGKYNTRTGIAKLYMQDARIKEKKFWKAPSIRGFAQWKNDKYVLGISDPAPAVFDTRSGKFEKFYIGNENNNYVNLQYVTNDTKNNVWLISKGLLYVSVPDYYFLQNRVIKKQLTTDYLPNQLGDIIFDDQHKIYYAASPFSSGVYVLDTNINVKKIIPVPLYTNSYTYKETGNEFITKDSSGRIWTTCLGTYILLPGNNEFLYADKIYPSLAWLKTRGETLGITTTRDGDILMLFADGAVFHINQKTLEADSITLPENNISRPFSITTKHINYDPARNKTYVNNTLEIAQYDLTAKSKKIIPPDVLFGTVDWKGQKLQYALDHQGRIWIWLQRYGVRIIDPDKLVCIDSIPSGTKGLISNNNVFIRNGGDSCMLFIGQEGLIIYNYYRQQSLFIDDNNGWEHQYDYCKKYCNGKIFVSASNSIQYFDMQHFSKIIPPLKLSLNYVTANDSLVFTNNYLNEPIQIYLQHDQNNITLSFSAAEFFFPERIEYAYRLTGVNNTWQYTNYFNRRVSFSALKPGKYLFLLKAQFKGGNWSMPPIEYSITIMPAWWQTDLFKLVSVIAAAFIVFLLLRWRINTLLKQEQFKAIQLREKSEIEKEILELEAKALRAQMNPHFIFNCMNSIKSLIQKNEQEKAIAYLTTFSKLIRTVFQNSDKKEISLYDEIETCRLYAQLESMRFSNKLNYTFDIAEQTDFKSIMVPPLILQPFIENAIWHGLMPKAEGGMLYVRVTEKESKIYCIVEDDGIGRSISMQNKFIDTTTYHQSKGMQLTQSRLELNNTLNQRNATVEIIDKTNDIGEPSGTRVILIFNEE